MADLKVVPLTPWLNLRNKFNDVVVAERDERRNIGDPTYHHECVAEAGLRHALARIEALETNLIEIVRSKASTR
jgi:hypothetical protein